MALQSEDTALDQRIATLMTTWEALEAELAAAPNG